MRPVYDPFDNLIAEEKCFRACRKSFWIAHKYFSMDGQI